MTRINKRRCNSVDLSTATAHLIDLVALLSRRVDSLSPRILSAQDIPTQSNERVERDGRVYSPRKLDLCHLNIRRAKLLLTEQYPFRPTPSPSISCPALSNVNITGHTYVRGAVDRRGNGTIIGIGLSLPPSISPHYRRHAFLIADPYVLCQHAPISILLDNPFLSLFLTITPFGQVGRDLRRCI